MRGVAVVEIDFQSPKGDLTSTISLKEDKIFRELKVYAFPRSLSPYGTYMKKGFESIKLGTIELNGDKFIFVSRIFFGGEISKIRVSGTAGERPAHTARAVLIHRDDFNLYGRDILALRDFLKEKREAKNFESFIRSNSAVFSKEKLTQAVKEVNGDWEFVGKVVDCFAANEKVNMYHSDLESANKLLRAVYLFLPLSKIENRTLATDCKEPSSESGRENYVLVPISSEKLEMQTIPSSDFPQKRPPHWQDEKPREDKDKRAVKLEKEEKKGKDFGKPRKGEGRVSLDNQEATPGRYTEKFQEVVREAVEGVEWAIGWQEEYRLLLEALEKVDISGKASIMQSSPEIQGIKRCLDTIDRLGQNINSMSDTLESISNLIGSEWYKISSNDRLALFLYYVKNLTDRRELEQYLSREDVELGEEIQRRVEKFKAALDSLKKAETLIKNIEEEVNNKILSNTHKFKQWLDKKQDEFNGFQETFELLDNFMDEKRRGGNFQKIPDAANYFLRSLEAKSRELLGTVKGAFTPYTEVRNKLENLVEKAYELDNHTKKLRKAVENSLKIIEESQWDKPTLPTKEEVYIYTLYSLLEPITSQLTKQIRDATPPLKSLQNLLNRGKNIYTNKLEPLKRTIISVENLDRILQK